MKNMRAYLAVLLTVSLLLTSCIFNTQPAIETAVAQTLQISGFETAAAGVLIEATGTPEPAVADTAAAPDVAPDPMPAATTGIVLYGGECYDFDDGLVSGPDDDDCDIWMAEATLIRQMYGMQLSGYVTLSAPTRSYCVEARYEPGDLAVQTDLYMCFITNKGSVGFMVAREYIGSMPIEGIVFDYWLFD
ncbi:MAG: hypothetical protein WEA61_03155 [Anaerolineales bacterium]